MSERVTALADLLGQMSRPEAGDLAAALRSKLNLQADVTVVQPPPEPEPVPDVQTEFAVHLTGYADAKKVLVIREIRQLKGLGLMESKTFVEAAPQLVHDALSKDAAEAMKLKIEAAGGTVEIR